MDVGRLACRSLIGGLFIAHGTQKLFGWFGGSGPDGTAKMMESLKLEPAKANAYMAGATEAGCGALLLTGLATPLAASGLIGVMTTAIRTAHWQKGFWNYNGGYEYNLVLITALAALAETGPGRPSLDDALGLDWRGSRWAIGAAALGVAASMATVALGRRQAAALAARKPAPQPAEQTPAEQKSDERTAASAS